MRASDSASSWSASGPRCVSSASSASGRSSQTPARRLAPASVRTSSPPSAKRSRNIGVLGPFAPGARYFSRPALIRWTISTSSSSSVGNRNRFARRRAPWRPSPSSAEGGGSKVFSVAMCAGPACAIGERLTSVSSRRRQASISGSSGTGQAYVRRASEGAGSRGLLVAERLELLRRGRELELAAPEILQPLVDLGRPGLAVVLLLDRPYP